MKDSEFTKQAFGLIPQIYRLAYARLGNELDAEDVVQETYMRAYKSFSTFRNQSSFKTWLTKILLNAIADHFRRTNRSISTVNLEDSLDLDVAGPTVAGPEETLCTANVIDSVRRALSKLPDQFATPLLLREFHDATYDEISEILNIPRGTVMSRLFRARTMLKKVLSTERNSISDTKPISEGEASPTAKSIQRGRNYEL